MWGNGFRDLLAFSMQMLPVLVTVSVVSLGAHSINWGVGLIVSALPAR